MSSLFFICLLLVLYRSSAIREYFFDSNLKDYRDAALYCKERHGYLAYITTEEEFNKAASLVTKLSWIGLKRTETTWNIWKWPNGKITNFTKWSNTEPGGEGSGENCVVMDRIGWRDTTCFDSNANFAPLCSWNFTLVKEKKTWEEALQHCRTHYTDLATVNEQHQLYHFKTRFQTKTETDSVWTGLRFHDGKWFWVNRVLIESLVLQPSQCPISPYKCGSYNFNTFVWENRDCNEKFTFICYD